MAELSEKAGKTWVLALTSVASFMVALDALVVTTALSTIRLDPRVAIDPLRSCGCQFCCAAQRPSRCGRLRSFATGRAT
jgi:hypothetical protein